METTEKKQYELHAWCHVWHPEQLTPEYFSAKRMIEDDDVLETIKDIIEENFLADDKFDWGLMLDSAMSMISFPEKEELKKELMQKAKDIFAEKGLHFKGNVHINWDIIDWDPFGYFDEE